MSCIEAIVVSLEQALLDPAVRADPRRLDALIADDFVEVGASGRSFGKHEVLRRLPAEHDVAFTVGDMMACMLAPNVALVTYTATRDHEGHSARSCRSSVWIKNARGWQMRYHQGTYVEALPTVGSARPTPLRGMVSSPSQA